MLKALHVAVGVGSPRVPKKPGNLGEERPTVRRATAASIIGLVLLRMVHFPYEPMNTFCNMLYLFAGSLS